MASQGKCKNCKIHYVFTDGVYMFANVEFRVSEILCPACNRPLDKTSKLSNLTKKYIHRHRLLIRDDNK